MNNSLFNQRVLGKTTGEVLAEELQKRAQDNPDLKQYCSMCGFEIFQLCYHFGNLKNDYTLNPTEKPYYFSILHRLTPDQYYLVKEPGWAGNYSFTSDLKKIYQEWLKVRA